MNLYNKFMISISINPTEDTHICVICMDEISENENFVTKCGHTFHQLCINRWFCNSPTCPICREKISLLSRLQLKYKLINSGEYSLISNENTELDSDPNTNLSYYTFKTVCTLGFPIFMLTLIVFCQDC
jgi:hypothetical protein